MNSYSYINMIPTQKGDRIMYDILRHNRTPFCHGDDACGCGHGHGHHEEHEHTHDEHCGCGHDHGHHEEHEHTHDEHCGCGHDHGHHEEHEHTHDEHCGCGHDHGHHEEHEHTHDERCGCGHDHGHHEEHEHTHDEHCGCSHDHTHHEGHKHTHDEHCSDTTTAVFLLKNLGCAHCAAKMEEKINALPDVDSAVITFATGQLRVSAYDPQKLLPQIQSICSSIESQVTVTPRDAVSKAAQTVSRPSADSDSEDAKAVQKESFFKKYEDPITILLGAILFIAGEVMEHLGFSEMSTLPVYLAAYAILGGPILLEAAKNISHGQIFDENFLMGIATIGAFAIREYPEAVGVMLFYRIGEYFEHKAVERSRGQIMDAIDLRPEVVNLLSGEEVQVIPAEDAVPGDILLIRPGDRIPLDGVIVEGNSRIDTSPITGEPVPVTVTSGDLLTSGCVNTSGQLKMRVEKRLSESMVSRILDSVENAAASKPKIDRFITRFSRVYTPCVVFGALAVAILPSIFTGNWNYWIYTALTFLVMSCPCALVLSVPLAFFSGIGAGSKRGILFKGGLSIEALGQVKAVVMDKTGTITEGNFQLQKIAPVGTWSEDELLRICAGCEQNSTHPIAHSITAAAKAKNLVPDTPAELEEIAGHGIRALLPEGRVLCGNRKLMAKYGIAVQQPADTAYGAEVFLAIDGQFAGSIPISDTLKQDAESAVKRLNAMGLHTVMLTGDSESSAKAVAAEAGIREVHAKLLPQDKLTLLGNVRSSHGSVMFVGDGINDAPVLAGADVGAAMGSGADAAIEAADAVFMQTAVTSIPDSIAIARATNRIAIQNVVFALVIKVAVMILGLLGFANMWMAVFADSGVAMLCVLNSVRVLYKK